MWYYVEKSERKEVYRKVLKFIIIFTIVTSFFLTGLEVFKLNYLSIYIITLVLSLIVLISILILCVLLIKDKNEVFKIIGIGVLSFVILVTGSLLLYSIPGVNIFTDNPHKMYLIGMIVELTMLNYALNLSNLDYIKYLSSQKDYSESMALRSQMNPHFVHNSLNAIQYFIQRNEVELSENYLSKFSKLIRLFFEYSRHKNILIKEELELLVNYLDIEKLRFEEKLNYTISVCDKIDIEDQLIPSMLLQPIVENAVNHGLFHKKESGLVKISFKQLDNSFFQVIIIDDGIGINKAKAIFKVSSKNYQSNSSVVLQERLDLLNHSKEWYVDYDIKDRSEIENNQTGTIVTLTFKQIHD
jgi:sensor histidine kinase YesM